MQNDYKSQIIRLQNEVNRIFGKVVTSVADFEQLAEKVHLSTDLAPLLREDRQGQEAGHYQPKPHLRLYRSA